MTTQRCLMTVHAHPDDESSKGAATVARYHEQGVETVLVCCTGGEQGDILNPAMDRDEIRANLPAVRRQELADATKIIGYDHVELLGYEDSGMAGSAANLNPACFAQADEAEAVGRLVALIRQYRPNVIITYDDKQEVYPHPDHLRVHDITVLAYKAAGDANAYIGVGEPWQPQKLYYLLWSMEKLRMFHQALLQLGAESPFSDASLAVSGNDDRITTRLDVSDWMSVRDQALRAHATQIEPTSTMWFGLPDDVQRRIAGEDDYILAESAVDAMLPETDLFGGIDD